MAVSITPVNTHLLRPPASIKRSMSRVKAPLILQATTAPSRLRVTGGDRKFLKLQASFPPIPDCPIRGSDPPMIASLPAVGDVTVGKVLYVEPLKAIKS